MIKEPARTASGRPLSTTHYPPSTRFGFTLIELLMVMLLIGILLALLIPAVGAVRSRVTIARVRTEISDLSTAIAQFKAKYGVEPPSSITLYEDATGWNANDAEARRSRAIIRKIWPSFDFSQTLVGIPAGGVTLNGAECLVFFLGGRLDAEGNPSGFSSNPAQPFAPGGNRVGPFFEFQLSRLMPSPLNSEFRVYVDPIGNQQTPYLYASSYDGRGYRSNPTAQGAQYDLAVFGLDNPQNLQDVYRQKSGGSATPYNAKSYQIISPGVDGLYGNGGHYEEDVSNTPGNVADRDNITNFHSGTLR